MELIIIPDASRLKLPNINRDKFVSVQNDWLDYVSNIIWYGVLKPEINNVTVFSNEKDIYEEIQFFDIYLLSEARNHIYEIAKGFFGQIRYPSIAEFHLDDEILICGCTFHKGKTDYCANVNKDVFLSHYIRKDCLSQPAKKQIERINKACQMETDLKTIYYEIYYAIDEYRLGGISRARVDRLIRAMTRGNVIPKDVRKYCTPYEFHRYVDNDSKYGHGRKESNYILVHDLEEVWYSFMKCPEIKNFIEKRYLKDLNEVISYIACIK